MLKWLGSSKSRVPSDDSKSVDTVTDDPLAAIGFDGYGKEIYSVSRSVYLPRVTLKIRNINDSLIPSEGGINPLYSEEGKSQVVSYPSNSLSKCIKSAQLPQELPTFSKKSLSSGYGGSHIGSSNFTNEVKLKDDAVAMLDQKGNYMKPIKIATASDRTTKRKYKLSSSHISGSSATGTLTTIPEGRLEFVIPKPIWPKLDLNSALYNSVDDVLLCNDPKFSLNDKKSVEEQTIKDIIVEFLNSINVRIENDGGTTERMLKYVNERISRSIDALHYSTEEDIRKLCSNLSNSKNILTVLRAFGNSTVNSISGDSSQTSSESVSGREHTPSSEVEDIYQIPSGCSSSDFSDSLKQCDINQLPIFVHEHLSNVPNGVRNAMIYGTLYRGIHKPSIDKCIDNRKCAVKHEKGLLQVYNDKKPSVWEQYYGVVSEGNKATYPSNPADVPVYPGGRPEADFTLDLPRSEFLTKRLEAAKKWRCRCRVLTSFLGLVFFLLSVMAVSLLLTRGKRMFGSMV